MVHVMLYCHNRTGWFGFCFAFLTSLFKWNYLGSNKLQKEASTSLSGFLYAGGDRYTYREYSMKAS